MWYYDGMEKAKNDEKILAEAAKIIRGHLGEKCKVFLFGSRADGTARERSDYDIGILPENELKNGELGEIKEELENLPTLYKIDVVDFSNVSENFYTVAMQNIINL